MGYGGKRDGAGRKAGVVGKAKRDLIQMAKDHSEVALETLVTVAKKGASESARVSAAVAILDRGYGKPPQFSTSNPEAFRKAIDLTDDELAVIATGGGDSPPPASLDTSKLN